MLIALKEVGGRGGDSEKVIILKIIKNIKAHGAQSFTEQAGFQTSAQPQGVCLLD